MILFVINDQLVYKLQMDSLMDKRKEIKREFRRIEKTLNFLLDNTSLIENGNDFIGRHENISLKYLKEFNKNKKINNNLAGILLKSIKNINYELVKKKILISLIKFQDIITLREYKKIQRILVFKNSNIVDYWNDAVDVFDTQKETIKEKNLGNFDQSQDILEQTADHTELLSTEIREIMNKLFSGLRSGMGKGGIHLVYQSDFPIKNNTSLYNRIRHNIWRIDHLIETYYISIQKMRNTLDGLGYNFRVLELETVTETETESGP